MASHDACLVADTYTSAWCGSLRYIDENDYLNTMAEAYSRIYLNLGIDQMGEMLIQMIDKYHIHGVVMHSNRSCKPYSLGQYDIQRMIHQRCQVPVLMLESDMLDARKFSENQIQTRIEAFVEMLDGRRR